MIQEYLFIGGGKRTEIEEYRPEKVAVEIYEVENSECWIATYSVPGEKEESANLLCTSIFLHWYNTKISLQKLIFPP